MVLGQRCPNTTILSHSLEIRHLQWLPHSPPTDEGDIHSPPDSASGSESLGLLGT